ncbi:MAG: carboxypeptidase regulatory-like domain-containing protein [Candidatus Cloacimonadaceae bacterium]|nr:carboxypeptidase regulatory-like domain-containing protein [Candidatus Cloacimonadaceae bacterium]
MKRLSLLLVMIITVCLSYAGIDDFYTFNATTGTYNTITGTAVPSIHVDDALSAAIPLGFTFAYGENSFTEIKISSNGWVGIGTAQTLNNLTNVLASTTIRPVIAPLWDDLHMGSGTVQYLLSGTAPNRIFTVQFTDAKWNYTATNQFSFQARIYETGKIDMVYGPSTGTPAAASASIGINMAPGGSGWYYSVTPSATATASMTAENIAVATFPLQGTIYEFNPVVAAANDLAALSITGATGPSVGIPSIYTISVRNRGSNPQTTYLVKLFSGTNVELGSVAGTAIAPNEILTFNMPWTPTVTGPASLYGKVVLAGDQNPANDQTPLLNIVVQAAGVVAHTVGNGGQAARLPVDMYWMNSLFQTIYQSSEMNVGGLITGLQFYNNFVTPLPNKPTKIWLAVTTQTNLTAGWIPSTQMTLVFDGTVNYPSGPNNIMIPLATPFVFAGGNLAMMVQRPMDTAYFSPSDYFDCQTVGTNRSRNVQSDTTVYDPTNPPATATISGQFPRTTFMMVVGGMGSLNGTVFGPGNVPLAGALVTVLNTTLTFTTGADGTYNFGYVNIGAQQVTAAKLGFGTVTHNVTITENQATTQNFTLVPLTQVTVTGRIVGSDTPTVGIAGATIALTGYAPYNATTNATGNFTITGVYASQTYNYVATATGYQPATGQAVVGTVNLNMGDVIVNEMAYPPYAVQAVENATFTQVNLTWQPPAGGAAGITQDFEATTFPPTGWSQVITDTSAPGTTGVAPTWCRFGTVAMTPPVPPHGGAWQTGLWWSYNHQDEWLITPQFACPPNANLTFWSYVFLGSTNQDHYYVKISTNNGSTWTTLWDATALTGGWNYYATPININLNAYAGQQIKISWHAVDGPANDGLWYVWFMDDISIGSPAGVMQFPADSFTTKSAGENQDFAMNVTPGLPVSRAMVNNPRLQEPVLEINEPSNSDRVLLGYRVWRLLAANQANESLWTQLTPANITPTNYTDTTWGPLPSGIYKYAVKAVYTNSVMSIPAFSNEIHKGMMGILTGTVTVFDSTTPIAGAIITAGTYSGTSNAAGVYNISIYAGTYNVTCAKPGYQTVTQNNVVIVGQQTTTQNFALTEITLPVTGVLAAIAGNNVNVTWNAPGTGGGAWINYDSGENNDSIGTNGVANFDVAIRFPPSALTNYVGMSLYALKLWPAQAGTFTAKVWTGGTATAPATMAHSQAFTPVLDTYNTVVLSQPIAITGSDELWFGYNCNVTTGYPAGCDAGPAITGFGNMIYWQNAWTTLLALAPSLNYNWNIQGYVGYSAPTAAPAISPISLKSAFPGQHSNMDRPLVGYKVWRLLQGQEGNETLWTSLTPNAISATAYQDTGWGPLPAGMYKWAVKAEYTGGAMSIPAFSNALQKVVTIGTIAGVVRTMTNVAISGATVTVGTVTATTNVGGAYSMQVLAGTHTVTASHPNYSPVSQTGVVVVTGQTTTVNFQLPASTNILVDGFETYANFALTFAPWTLVDVDQSPTYTMDNTTWPNAGEAMSYIIFVPSATTPPVTNAAPHGGIKMAACFAATNPPSSPLNNDWMITPQLPANASQVKFWARSYTAQYGLERMKVGVSTTGTNPNNFTIISGAQYISVPVAWTEYTYNVSSYTQPFYVGIQCVSADAFILFVDDVLITSGVSNDDNSVPVVATELHNNFPNPFNPETTISFGVRDASLVTIDIYNVKGQLVKTLLNEIKESGNHSVIWRGTDNNNRAVSSGVYYYKMSAGKYSSTKKMILMK